MRKGKRNKTKILRASKLAITIKNIMQHITDATYLYFIQPNKTKYSQAVTFHIYWFITKVLSSAINMIIELTAMLSDNFFFQ